MSRVTAAFVCALCDPDNPRPASIMCSNNCGRYVCAVHAMPRKGPGSPMICLACAEALGLIEKAQPRSEPTPIVNVQPEPESQPAPRPTIVAPTRVEEPAPAAKPAAEPAAAAVTAAETAKAAPPVDLPKTEPSIAPVKVEAPREPPAKPEVRPLFDTPSAAPVDRPGAPLTAAKPDPGATLVNVPPIKRAESPATPVVPAEQQSQAARRLVEPPPPPQSSETIVSQRGNTLQVPKVSQTGPRPAQSTGARPRVAQRAEDIRALDRPTLISLGLSAVGGIIGLVLLLIAVFGR